MNEAMQLGRAKNAVLRFFEKKLYIPKIYIDAEWAGIHLDVLAIDRDGIGDAHAVLLFPRKYNLDDELAMFAERSLWLAAPARFAKVPAQYKYIGIVDLDSTHKKAALDLPDLEGFYAPDGLGRLGILKVDVPVDGDAEYKLEVKPERFRARIADLADRYVAEHIADWELRA